MADTQNKDLRIARAMEIVGDFDGINSTLQESLDGLPDLTQEANATGLQRSPGYQILRKALSDMRQVNARIATLNSKLAGPWADKYKADPDRLLLEVSSLRFMAQHLFLKSIVCTRAIRLQNSDPDVAKLTRQFEQTLRSMNNARVLDDLRSIDQPRNSRTEADPTLEAMLGWLKSDGLTVRTF